MANPTSDSGGKASSGKRPNDLAALLTRILHAPSPFYAARLREAGLDAARVSGNALARLPLTRRQDMVRDQLAHLPHGTRRFGDAGLPVRAGVSGSGDELLVLTWSAADLARERAAGTRLLEGIGVSAGTRVANALPGALVTPGSLLLGDVVEELGGLDVPLGEIGSDGAARQAWELVDRVQPAVLVLEPGTAPRLLAAAPAKERPWWRGIVWLQRGGAAMAAPAAPAGFHGWQRTWLAVVEATSFVAHTCREGRYHIEDGVIAEVAETGTLALTPLGFDTPLLRYDTGIPAEMAKAPCPCGDAGAVVKLK